MADMKGFRENASLDDAVDALLSLVDDTVGNETVAPDDAQGRVAGEDVEADRPVPHYDRAAMDGYAVRAEDTHGATEASPVMLGAEEATGVHTGDAVPEDADAVVRVEETEEVGDGIEVYGAVSESENVASTGEDIAEGETVVREGSVLRPSRVALLRSVGADGVRVRRRPTVGIVPTGDEIVVGDPGPGENVDTNAGMVAGYVRRWGGEPSVSDTVPDDEGEIRRALLDAAGGSDMVATIGGSSVGDRDLVPGVVDEVGDVVVHGVAVRPGHPVGVGVVGDTPVVVLPGYPVSCVVNSFEFVRRGVRGLLGSEGSPEPAVRCTLDSKIASEAGVRTYTRAEITEEGRASPVRTKGAGVLSSVAGSDGFVVTPESREGHAEGDEVEVLLWEA